MASYTRTVASNNGIWGSSSNWSPAGVPASGDTTTYLSASFSGTYNLYVSGNSAASTFTFNNTFSGTMNFKGGTAATPAVRTLSIGSGGIDMSAAAADVTFDSFCNAPMLAAQAWNVASGRVLRFDGVVSGGFVPTKSGAGTLVLTNANTHSAGMTLSAGTTQVSNNAALGTGTVTVTGGTLSSASTTGYTLANALSLNGTITLGDATNNGGLTFTGGTAIAGTTSLTISGNTFVNMSGAFTGSGSLTVLGGFGLFFTNQTTNTWSGALTVNGANVYAGSSNSGICTQLEASANPITVTSGQLFYLGATAATLSKTHTGAGTLSIANAGGVTFNTGTMTGLTGTVQTFSDTTTSVSSLARFFNWPTAAGSVNGYSASSSSGTHTLEYSGSANVNVPTQNWNRYATAGAQTMLFRHYGTSSATFSLSGSVTHQSATNAIGLQFDVNSTAGLLTVSGPISQASTGVFNVTKLGVGAMTLSGNNTFTGTVSVSAGTLNANSATALGADTNSGSVTSGATLSLGAALNYSTRTFTINGTGVSTGGALVHAFAGTAKIGAITLGAAAYVRGTATGTLSSSLALATFTLTAGAASGTTLSLTGGISNGSLTVGTYSSDTGTVALTTANSYAGTTTLSQYGTLSLGHASALGTSTLTFNGGTLDASTPLTLTNALASIGSSAQGTFAFSGTSALTLSGNWTLDASRTITVNGSGGALTLSGIISGVLNRGITKAGANTLILSGANTFAGNVIVNEGVLIANSSTALGTPANASGGSVAIGATLKMNAAQTYNVQTWYLAGNGSSAGAALVLNTSGAVKLGSVTLNADASIESLTTGCTFYSNINATNKNLSLSSNPSVTTYFSGSFNLGAGSVYIQSLPSGKIILTTANSYSGYTGLEGGTLQLSNASACGTSTLYFNTGIIDVSTSLTLTNALLDISDITFAGTDALTLSGNLALTANRIVTANGSGGALTLSGVVSGSGFKLTKAGTNTLKLTNANTYSGGTDVGAGTIQAGNIQALGTSGTVTLTASGATLQTLTAGGQNGKLTVAALTNSAGGTIRIGG